MREHTFDPAAAPMRCQAAAGLMRAAGGADRQACMALPRPPAAAGRHAARRVRAGRHARHWTLAPALRVVSE
ncbi:hypothetical protein [Xanthomonas theicola]|uniref:Uncharacterized protein n=1 Tax=Xanthomonas theicola TaxID=56464 RepID=A0A2S6ZLA0_9XANT|nr:hypothetical protein [Xanthomonas theicola]PPT92976.1 hypothetical protein XthCFBP4691_01990 [Xanthomonas theicola]QNH23791.1 hypothetical protein G4Q83_02035 [Xanthomonas theicola]